MLDLDEQVRIYPKQKGEKREDGPSLLGKNRRRAQRCDRIWKVLEW